MNPYTVQYSTVPYFPSYTCMLILEAAGSECHIETRTAYPDEGRDTYDVRQKNVTRTAGGTYGRRKNNLCRISERRIMEETHEILHDTDFRNGHNTQHHSCMGDSSTVQGLCKAFHLLSLVSSPEISVVQYLMCFLDNSALRYTTKICPGTARLLLRYFV